MSETELKKLSRRQALGLLGAAAAAAGCGAANVTGPSATPTATTPTTTTPPAITVVNASANCAPVTNASVEIWHCDAAGNYSEYGSLQSSTWLRGIQPVDASGVARFTTV